MNSLACIIAILATGAVFKTDPGTWLVVVLSAQYVVAEIKEYLEETKK